MTWNSTPALPSVLQCMSASHKPHSVIFTNVFLLRIFSFPVPSCQWSPEKTVFFLWVQPLPRCFHVNRSPMRCCCLGLGVLQQLILLSDTE